MVKRRIETGAVRATEWIGTTNSLIAHTIIFAASFAFVLAGAPLNAILLILTTVVSLEAIYLAIFIQMTVNRNTRSLEEVEEDIEEIQEDVKEIETDVEEMSGDIDKIQEKDEEESAVEDNMRNALAKIERDMGTLLKDIEMFKQRQQSHVS